MLRAFDMRTAIIVASIILSMAINPNIITSPIPEGITAFIIIGTIIATITDLLEIKNRL